MDKNLRNMPKAAGFDDEPDPPQGAINANLNEEDDIENSLQNLLDNINEFPVDEIPVDIDAVNAINLAEYDIQIDEELVIPVDNPELTGLCIANHSSELVIDGVNVNQQQPPINVNLSAVLGINGVDDGLAIEPIQEDDVENAAQLLVDELHGDQQQPDGLQKCGACRFSRTKCSADCVFRPYFPNSTHADFGIIANAAGRLNLKWRLNSCLPENRIAFLNLRRREGLIVANDSFGGCAAALDQKDRLIEELNEKHAQEIKKKDDLIKELRAEKVKVSNEKEEIIKAQAKALANLTDGQQQQFQTHAP